MMITREDNMRYNSIIFESIWIISSMCSSYRNRILTGISNIISIARARFIYGIIN